ncbi:hypothetical protein TDB9533_04789 [Thalassocella blandensis]|nr:hypothetical protein TDB9533_04789 [Thalassocella blandensis]
MTLSDLVENSGKLISVKGYCFVDLPYELAAMDLKFERCNCFIRINEETDEINVCSHFEGEGLLESNINVLVSKYIGLELLWAWGLVNNQGYSDGLRLQFKNIETAIEFVVEASSIKQFLIKRA